MLLILQILLSLCALLLFYLSMQWVFKTKNIAKEHQIEYSGSTGANFLKGDIAGLLLTGSLMIPLFIFHNKLWFFPIVLLLLCVIINRILSLIMDGHSKQGVIAIAVEVVIIGLSYAIYVQV